MKFVHFFMKVTCNYLEGLIFSYIDIPLNYLNIHESDMQLYISFLIISCNINWILVHHQIRYRYSFNNKNSIQNWKFFFIPKALRDCFSFIYYLLFFYIQCANILFTIKSWPQIWLTAFDFCTILCYRWRHFSQENLGHKFDSLLLISLLYILRYRFQIFNWNKELGCCNDVIKSICDSVH